MNKVYQETGSLNEVYKRTPHGWASIYKYVVVSKPIPVVNVPQETFAEILKREDKQNWRLFSIGFLLCSLVVLMAIFIFLNFPHDSL